MIDDLLDEFRDEIAAGNTTASEVARVLGVSGATVSNWINGDTEPQSYNRKRIREWLDGDADTTATVDRGCRIRGCEFPPRYEYHNPHSGAEGRYCGQHMDSLRPDMDADDWMELGYAKRINDNRLRS